MVHSIADDPDLQPEVVQGDLFGRVWKVSLGEVGQPFAWDVSGMSIEFRCTKNLKAEPNTIELTVFNLGPDFRHLFNNAKKLNLTLAAGYKGVGLGNIFQGQVRSAWSIHDGPDWRTTVRAGDGEKNIKARVALTFGPQVSSGDAIRQIAKKLGLKPGNMERALGNLRLSGLANIYPEGGAVVGNAWRELQGVARSAGLEASIQDGALQILDLHQPLADVAVLVSKDSGLIGSPEVNADGRVTITTLMIPALCRPGVKVDLRSEGIQGGYRVEELEITGQSRGNDWYIRSTCRRY